jgi:hypothetical protein
MHRRGRAFRSACKFVLLAFGMLDGCASAPAAPSPPTAEQTPPQNPLAQEFRTGPTWLMKCDLAFADQQRHPICGVDGIIDAKNPMLARTGAEAKARANLAKKIRTAIKACLVSYETKRRQGAGERPIDELYVEDTSKEITEMTLVGVKVHNTYRSPQGWVWVMVTMDRDTFRQEVQRLDQYDQSLRKEIVDRAVDSFRELDAATDSSTIKAAGATQ